MNISIIADIIVGVLGFIIIILIFKYLIKDELPPMKPKYVIFWFIVLMLTQLYNINAISNPQANFISFKPEKFFNASITFIVLMTCMLVYIKYAKRSPRT